MKTRIGKIEEEITKLRSERTKLKQKSLLKCLYCKKATQVCKLTYIQKWWYKEPFSCTGGDYWVPSDEVVWKCPKCGERNRVWKSTFNSKKINKFYEKAKALRSYFKDEVDEYKD